MLLADNTINNNKLNLHHSNYMINNNRADSPKQSLFLSQIQDTQFSELLQKNSQQHNPSFISQQIVYNYAVFEPKVRSYNREDWQKISKQKEKSLISYSELEFNLRNGIPDDLRPRFWFWLCDMPKLERRFKGQFDILKNIPSDSDDQINKDIPRTLSNHQFFNIEKSDANSSYNSSDYCSPQLSKNTSTLSNNNGTINSSRSSYSSTTAISKGQQMLFNILRAYANLDKELGYVQGMNILAAHILLNLRPEKFINFTRSFGNKCTEQQVEEKVFLIFCHIMIDKNWRQTYLPGFVRLYLLTEQIEKQLNPEIASHFKQIKLEMLPSFQQFYLNFMLKDVTTEFGRRFIDLFLHKGEILIQEIILRLLDMFQNEILQIKEPFDCQIFIAQEMLKKAIKIHKNDLSIILPLTASYTRHM